MSEDVVDDYMEAYNELALMIAEQKNQEDPLVVKPQVLKLRTRVKQTWRNFTRAQQIKAMGRSARGADS